MVELNIEMTPEELKRLKHIYTLYQEKGSEVRLFGFTYGALEHVIKYVYKDRENDINTVLGLIKHY